MIAQPEALSDPRPPGMGNILVLGLGNDILTDDAIGLNVVRQLREELAGDDRVDVRETMEMGLALLDFIVGYRAVVIVDSIQTGRVAPGTIHEVDAAGLKQLTGRTPHFLGVGETLALGRRLALPMPEVVKILAVEVEDPFTLGTELTPSLRRVLPAVVEKGLCEIQLQLTKTPKLLADSASLDHEMGRVIRQPSGAAQRAP